MEVVPVSTFERMFTVVVDFGGLLALSISSGDWLRINQFGDRGTVDASGRVGVAHDLP